MNPANSPQNSSVTLRKRRAEHWIRQIDDLLSQERYEWSFATLQGIRRTIESTEHASDRQIQAIKNIKWGRQE